MTQPAALSPLPQWFLTAFTALSLTLGGPGVSAQALSANLPTVPPPPAPSEPNLASITPLDNNPKAVIDEVWQLVHNEFIGKNFNTRDWQAKRQELLSQSYPDRKDAYRTITKILKQLGDPYTRFLTPDDFSDLTSQTSGEISGVGLRLVIDKRSSDLVVADALRNTPAAKAGILPGDRLIRIDGKPTALMNLEQASQAIQGEVGTAVNLQLSRQGKGVFTVTLQRVQIELDAVTYSVKQEGNLRVGYIRLDEFSSHAAEQMKAAIETLNNQNITGYILDLRGNPGGLLFASVDIARLWLDRGEIVSTIDRKGGDRHFSANGTRLTHLPLVILVNQRSASASEILTGALKENGRATIVGTETYGKGTVQSVHSLSDGSGLAVTIARYYPPSGTDINQKGISPDIYLDLSSDQQLRLRNDPALVGTAADPQYSQALTVLKRHQATLGETPLVPKSVGIRP
jgi:carboxyl-terminal processing protease